MIIPNSKRLIEVAFPLKQASLDSVHEKNVRHGHISTLHIWPARRPLAASRAALIATLLPDPGNPRAREAILERMAGRVVEKVQRRRVNGRVVEKVKEETAGGILHWGRENGPDLDWFRKEIRKAYGGRAPKVLDPFAGGGAIPLEAMRLGCEVTATDINPVAWFILKCTLEYPQRLAGQTRPLPEFALKDRQFMEAFLKAKGFKGANLRASLERLGHGNGTRFEALSQDDPVTEADLAWHVRAWGRWVFAGARKELASYYPTYAEFQPLTPDSDHDPHPIRLLDVDDNGVPQLEPINAEFGSTLLKDPLNPRWVAKPTAAYLWARTVTCKQCRATLPLLKTRWLCKKDRKRVLLTMEPDAEGSGVVFGDATRCVPALRRQRRHSEGHTISRIGAGTMSRTGATCPCCGAIMTMQDIRLEGRAGRLAAVMTAVVVSGSKGKEYRIPTDHEREVAEVSEERLQALYADIPFGLPDEPLPSKEALGFRVPLYGFDTWRKLFTNRQLLTQCALIKAINQAKTEIDAIHDPDVSDSIVGFLACIMDRQADYGSTGCIWVNSNEHMGHQFSRFALPIVWDLAEVCPFTTASGGLESAYDWVTRVVDHLQAATLDAPSPKVELKSAIVEQNRLYDAIITDPPYYDAIPYSDLMDFFHIWLRRVAHSVSNRLQDGFVPQLGPKWDAKTDDGELIDDASRFGGDRTRSKQNYEDGWHVPSGLAWEHLSQTVVSSWSLQARVQPLGRLS